MKKTLNNMKANPSKLMFYISALFLLIAIVLLSITLRVQQYNQALIHAKPGSAYAIQKQIHSGEVIMSIEGVSFQAGKQPFVAPEGKHYAIVDFKVKNVSDRPIQVLPSSDTYMKNTAGDVGYLSPYAIRQPFRAGELAPGETIHGELSYLVDTSGTVKLIIDAKWSGIAVPIVIQGEEK